MKSDGWDKTLRALGQHSAPALAPELEAELAALQPVRLRRPRREWTIALVASLAWVAALVGGFGLRGDLPALPETWLLAHGAIWLLGFATLAWLALVPRSGAVMPRARVAGMCAAGAVVLYVAVGLLFAGASPASFSPPNTLESLLHFGLGCLTMGTFTAVLPIVVLSLLLRGRVPLSSRWAAAAVGAAGGCVGGLFLHLRCPVATALHLGVAHAGVVLLSALLAATLAAPRLRP